MESLEETAEEASLVTIPLESDKGLLYEQLERLAFGENIPEWSSFEATKAKTLEVCKHVLLEIGKEEAQLEPIHLSFLKKTIIHMRELKSTRGEQDFKVLNSALRLWLVQKALKRESESQ